MPSPSTKQLIYRCNREKIAEPPVTTTAPVVVEVAAVPEVNVAIPACTEDPVTDSVEESTAAPPT